MAPTLSVFQLSLFGRLSLRAFGQEILGPGKPTFLLAYLACQPRRRAGRGRIIDLLWREAPPSRGRQTLRQTILQLRRRVNAELIVAEEDDLVLAPAVQVDRDQFLAAFEMESWGEAARLAAAPVLRDAVVPGGAAFERWIEIERRHCRDLEETAVAGAVEAAIRSGDVARAVATATHWRDADPNHEPAWQRLIATMLEVGDGSHARLEARHCISALAQQGEMPSPVTQEILVRADATLVVRGSPLRDPLLHPDLAGRSDLFAALMAAQREAVRGAPRLALLSASAGMGKTRLLEALGERLAGTAMDVTTIKATSATQTVDGGVLADLVVALGSRRGATGVSVASARVLVAIAPALEKQFAGCLPITDWSPSSTRMIHALEEVLVALAEDRPQALLLDDLHRWDPVSEVIVCAALARCQLSRLLVVATSRRLQPAFPAGTTHILPPLTVEQVEALLQGMADADGPMLDLIAPPIHGASSGVPQRVLETVHWLIERGALQRQNGSWMLVDAEIFKSLTPETVVLDERIARLPVNAARVVRWLAVADQPLPRRLFGDGALDPLLEEGGFVVIGDDVVSLGHETIGERLLEHESAEAVQAIEVDIARAILDATALSRGQLRLAGQLAVKAKSSELLAIVFDRWVMQTPQRAGELEAAWPMFLGVTDQEVAALAQPDPAKKTRPWRWRG